MKLHTMAAVVGWIDGWACFCSWSGRGAGSKELLYINVYSVRMCMHVTVNTPSCGSCASRWLSRVGCTCHYPS